MRSAPFRSLLLAAVLGFGGYALLLPVVPLWTARGGAGELGAGASTGVLMAATVLAQLITPWLLRRLGHRAVLAGGMLLLGGPAPLHALSADLVAVLGVSVLRGIGFGLLTVAGSALVAELTDPGEHGRASARFGYAIGLPQLVFLPAGVAVVDTLGFPAVFVAAGVAPVLAAVVVLLPTGPSVPRPARRPEPAGSPDRPRAAGWRTLRVAPIAAMLACSTGQGAIITFAPILAPAATVAVPLALLLTALGALVGRGLAGTLVDRRGRPGVLLPVGAVLAALGMLAVAATAGPLPPGTVAPGSVALVAGAAAVGFGFGLVQNDALVVLFSAAGPSRYGTASAGWNIAYDAGTGLGASGLGALAEPFGFAAAFAVSAATLFLLTVLVRRRPG